MKLWQKKVLLNKKVEEYTCSEDVLLDQKLVEVDCKASIAHAKMLQKIGVITGKEFGKLKKELNKIIELNKKGKFVIAVKDEDVHTKIENQLTQKLGDLGKKIHFARSRNDQVLVDTRLYTKQKLSSIKKKTKKLVGLLEKKAKQNKKVVMPGFTHTRKAMPSDYGIWFGAFADALKDDLELLEAAYNLNDQNPLGSCAGYGTNVKIDRKLTTKLLGFAKMQKNPLYVQNSRGKIEAAVLFALSEVMLDLSKFASDVILFSCEEFGYLELDEEICTGSSIMPQKKNPDALELVRANFYKMQAYMNICLGVSSSLMSGFHRDLQVTKEPLIKGLELAENTIDVMLVILPKMKINKKKSKLACTPEIYATYKANKLALQGVPFRDAYKKVARELEQK